MPDSILLKSWFNQKYNQIQNLESLALLAIKQKSWLKVDFVLMIKRKIALV